MCVGFREGRVHPECPEAYVIEACNVMDIVDLACVMTEEAGWCPVPFCPQVVFA